MNVAALLDRFPDDASAAAWFAAQRWPDGVHCPRCNSDRIQTGAVHANQPYRCRHCGKRFSVKTGTVMRGSNLGCRAWAIAIWAMTVNPQPPTAAELGRWLGIHPKTAWVLAHKIRHAMARDTLPFRGPVACDEGYFGGQQRFRHAWQRKHPPPKTIVAVLRDLPTGLAKAAIIPGADRWTLRAFLDQRTTRGVLVYTDESTAYRGLPHHQTVNHSAGEYVDGEVSTNACEALIRWLKMAYRRSYWWSPRHFARYLASSVTRFNLRPLPPDDRMAWVARALVGRRLRYVDLVAGC